MATARLIDDLGKLIEDNILLNNQRQVPNVPRGANDVLTKGRINNWAMDVLKGKPIQTQTIATETSPLDVLYPKGGNVNLRNYFGKVGTSGFPKNILTELVPQGIGNMAKQVAMRYGIPALAGAGLGAGIGWGLARYRNNWAQTPDGTAIDYARQSNLQDWTKRYTMAGGKPYETMARYQLAQSGNINPTNQEVIPLMERLYTQDKLTKDMDKIANQEAKTEEQLQTPQFNSADYVTPVDSIENIILSRAGEYNPNEELPNISQAPTNIYGSNETPTLRDYADIPQNTLTGGVDNSQGYDFNNLQNYMTPGEASYQKFLNQSPLLDPNKLVDLIKQSDRERYNYELMNSMMGPGRLELVGNAPVIRHRQQQVNPPMTNAEAILKAYDTMGKAYKLQSELEDKAIQRQGVVELANQMGINPMLLNNEKILTEIIKGQNAIDKAKTIGEQARLTNEAEIKAKSVANRELSILKANLDNISEAYKQGNRVKLKEAETKLKQQLLDYGANTVQAKNVLDVIKYAVSMGQDPNQALEVINRAYPGTLDLGTSNTFNNQMMINQQGNDYAGM